MRSLKTLETITGRDFTRERVELSAASGFNGLSHCKLRECELVIKPKGMPAFRFGARTSLGFVELDGCHILADARLHLFSLSVRARVTNCRFTGGPYTSPTFGQEYPSITPEVDGWPSSFIGPCDLSEAHLENARFYDVTRDQLTLPGWPHISLAGGEGTTAAFLTEVQENPTLGSVIKDALRILGLAAGNPKVPFVFVVQARELLGRGADADTIGALRSELTRLAHPALRF